MQEKEIRSVLKFWFHECTPENWFEKNDAFDDQLKERFGKLIDKAKAGQLDAWAESPSGLLALILLLDQMTRNIFRDTPHAFSGDEMALAFSLKGVDSGYLDLYETLPERQFLLMPMMHAEDIDIQNRSLPLFKKYTSELTYEYAVKHQVIIERFGHFPHRNAILGRPSTDEEVEFLDGPDSSF
jgi:uncharacterized protein (DUF924 family)